MRQPFSITKPETIERRHPSSVIPFHLGYASRPAPDAANSHWTEILSHWLQGPEKSAAFYIAATCVCAGIGAGIGFGIAAITGSQVMLPLMAVGSGLSSATFACGIFPLLSSE